MLFWIVAGALAALVAALLARPLLAAPAADPAVPEAPSDRAVYRDQMAEIGRDLDRGILAPEEAERARLEVARRLLAADRAARALERAPPPRATWGALGLGGAAVVVGSLLLYADLGAPGARDAPRAGRLLAAEEARAARPTQAEAEEAAPDRSQEPPADVAPLVARLREEVPGRPDDVEGWTLLSAIEGRLGRYAAAARAQERVVAIRGDGATAADRALLADLLVAAAGGAVTEETEAVLDGIAAAEPDHPAVLYYRGLLEAQVGRFDRAFPLWRRLVEDGAEGLHRDMALDQLERVAAAAGTDWTPPVAPPSDASQAETIRGMVEGLRARLDAEGGPPEDWARLVTSLSVLGDREGAAEALAQARAIHGGHPAGRAVLDAAAQQAGLE